MLGVDIQGSSDETREEDLSSELVEALEELLAEAFRSQGIGPSAYVWQGRGDGGRYDFEDVSPVSVIMAVLEQVPLRLRRHNRRVASALRLSLRFVVHDGYVVPRGVGSDHNGRAVQDLHGILDSTELRACLRDRDGWVLAVSESIWRTVIVPGHGDLDARAFVPTAVRVKGTREVPVWVAPRPMNAEEATPPAAETTADGGVTRPTSARRAEQPRSIKFDGPATITGAVVVEGDQYLGGRDAL